MTTEETKAGDTSALAPTLRERLKDGAPVVPVMVKPAAKSKAIPAWMRRVAGAASATDRDGVVENPTDTQRSMQSRLSGMFPRGPGV
jgi:hypothetical protein